MPYCPHCGVEVDTDTSACPLCRSPIPVIDAVPFLFGEVPENENKLHYGRRRFTRNERTAALNFSILIILVPFTTVLTVDLIMNGLISWSVYPITALVSVFGIVACSLFVRNPWMLLGSFLLNALVTAFIFHYASGTVSAFFRWSLPVATAASAVTIAAILYGVGSSSRGINIAGAVLWAVALFCLLLDFIISFNLQSGTVIDGWSIITSSVLFPLGSLFFYVHYRFGGRISLSRYFNA